ncbi:MAG: hypothetical protein WBA12_15285 [Catalinimonas sp.]
MEITAKPHGGLCNRILAMNACLALAERTGGSVRFVWALNHYLNARFEALFEPLHHPTVPVRVETYRRLPRLYSDRSLPFFKQRLYNRLLKVYQRRHFGRVLHTHDVRRLIEAGFTFDELARHDAVYLSFWGSFDGAPVRREWFRPRAALAARAGVVEKPYVSLHVRRTDHALVTRLTPTEKYVRAMHEEVRRDPDVRFFLASDDEEVKALLAATFPGRVMTHQDRPADRDSAAGMVAAAVDLFTLAGGVRVYGSPLSTFAHVAGELGGVDLIDVARLD